MGGPAKAHAPDITHPPDNIGADGHLMGIEAKLYMSAWRLGTVRIDRSPEKTLQGELKAPVAIDPKTVPFRFTHRVRHDHQEGVSQRAAV